MSVQIKIKHRNLKMHLILEDKITVIVGNSATGKSSIHKVLTDGDSKTLIKVNNNKYKIIYISNGAGFDINTILTKNNIFKSNYIYLIDEGRLEIDDKIAKAIQYSTNSYFLITSRTNLDKLNYSITAVKELVTQENGITVLKNYLNMDRKSKDELKITELQSIIIEDSGKAKKWFDKLLNTRKIATETPKNSGKDQLCDLLRHKLENTTGNILMIFDECSFGSNLDELNRIINKYKGRVLILSDYKSWEYMILKSNMYKKNFKQYSIDTPMFEEKYYEELLDKLSKNNKYTRINHESGRYLSKCYTDKCCEYKNRTEKCNFGLKGNDKFIALLKNTDFEDLLLLARRI